MGRLKRTRTFACVLALLLLISACSEGAPDPSDSDASKTPAGSAAAEPTPGTESEAPADAEIDEEKNIQILGDGFPYTVVDCYGYETVIEERPQRVAFLSGQPLNMWYELGGTAVCTASLDGSVLLMPEYEDTLRALPSLGMLYAIDMEAVISYDPDLVIANRPQTSMTKQLRELGCNVIQLYQGSYQDVVDAYETFGTLLNAQDAAQRRIDAMEREIEEIKNAIPQEPLTIAILYVTSSSVAVKLSNSISGDVANILGFTNIAAGLPPDTIGSETTPLDIEYLVEQDPDFIFVTTMLTGDNDPADFVYDMFQSNAAWGSVRAISEGDIAILPQSYFLYNAGPLYPRAVEYMAKCVYPDSFPES